MNAGVGTDDIDPILDRSLTQNDLQSENDFKIPIMNQRFSAMT
jgi:hypothetical protein